MSLTDNQLCATESGSDRANYPGVKVMRVKYLCLLFSDQSAKSRELTNCVCVVKGGQREFGHIRVFKSDLSIKRPLISNCSQLYIKSARVNAFQKLDCLTLGAATLEIVNQVENDRS